VTTVGQLLRKAEVKLAAAGIVDARLEAELVWMSVLDLDRTHLFAQLRLTVQESAMLQAERLMDRRLRREPAAYIMGHREFYGLDFIVAPGVLVPRPETETLVEEAMLLLGQRHWQDEPPTVADVGTGSGVIAVTLAVHLPQVVVYGMDISSRALEVAALNSQRHGVADRVCWLQGELLAPLDQPVDLVVANLPYVMTLEIQTLEPEVRLYEPLEALDGGRDGLEVIGRLLRTAGSHLKRGAALALELDTRQVERATQLAGHAFPGAVITGVPDLTGRPRVLTIRT
jgi:release factor glutamine methyltransferase